MFHEEWHQEKIDRHLIAAQSIPFGVSYLDDALGGILPNDLMLIGARTGRGKTELATSLALNASSKSKRVVFFALEADRWEIHRRMKYRRLLQLYHQHYANQTQSFRFPRYREWLMQGYWPEWDALEKEAEQELRLQTYDLTVVYKGEKYSVDDFVADMEALSLETDLFIVDHLHYFDILGTSETEGLKRAAHAVRNAAVFHSKPVILLAHLRKGERLSGAALPGLDDFHGHSDIAKVATMALLMSPVPTEKIPPGMTNFPTYFHLAKARSASEATPFVAIHGFDLKKNSYTERYHLERANFTDEPTPLKNDEIPVWAKNAYRTSQGGIYAGRESAYKD